MKHKRKNGADTCQESIALSLGAKATTYDSCRAHLCEYIQLVYQQQ